MNFSTGKISLIKIKSVHQDAYKPDGCAFATVTGIFYDEMNKRMAVAIVYANGFADWIPLSELMSGNYEIQNT